MELDEKDEDDYSDGLVFRIDTDAWRLKSPDEIDQTHEEDMICKYDVYNDFEINFRKVEDNFDPEELSIYRVSVTPLTEGSVIKQIDMIKSQGEEVTQKESRFEDLNEIVFIKSDISIFDNSQVDSNQIFLISSPYTLFLWIGQKVSPEILKGTLSIFRSFYYTIRKTPMIFFPSYMEEEQNLGIPNLQIIYKNSEDSRFQSLFKHWREIRFGYMMLRTSSDYKSRGRKAVNKPRFLTITGKLTKLEDAFAEEEDEKVADEEEKDENLTQEDLKIFRNSATKKHKDKKISALVHVDLSHDQKKQLSTNLEVELNYYQGQIVKSMLVRYEPHRIFCTLPGDEDKPGSKIALSRIFHYEIQGSKYSKPKSDIEKGIFERSTS